MYFYLFDTKASKKIKWKTIIVENMEELEESKKLTYEAFL